MEDTAGPRSALVWDDSFLQYRFSDTHPMDPVRLKLTHRLAAALGVLDEQKLTQIQPPVATDAQLASVHSIDYIAQVKAASADAVSQDAATLAHIARVKKLVAWVPKHGPYFPHRIDHQVVLPEDPWPRPKHPRLALWAGDVDRVVTFAGGMHHARRSAASGFCIYSDAAIAIQYMLDQGAQRVAYVDLDAHHGDGVERAFWSDPRVLTISIHGTGLM